MSLLIFIGLLVALIWVHELGHFSVAKLFGIRVDEFSIGFPPRILSIQRGETRYSIGAVLLGGYVNIRGEDGSGESDPRAMSAKPRLVQAAVVAAGVVMNLLFGWLLLSAGYMAGMQTSTEYTGFGVVENPKVTIVAVVPNGPAQKAGLAEGDTIELITAGSAELAPTTGSGGKQTQDFITAHQEESLIFSVLRDGAVENILVKPAGGIVEDRKVVGIQMADVGFLQLPPHLALLQGAVAAYDMTLRTAQGLGSFFSQLVLGKAEWSDVSGPVGIAGIGAGAVESGFSAAMVITALISINLALFNLIPIPGLDGFRLLIIGIESVLRRAVSPRVTGVLSLAGLLLIVGLMLVVTYHDIARLIG